MPSRIWMQIGLFVLPLLALAAVGAELVVGP
jgi:hypothetical protein